MYVSATARLHGRSDKSRLGKTPYHFVIFPARRARAASALARGRHPTI
jgi:hypothetical protein